MSISYDRFKLISFLFIVVGLSLNIIFNNSWKLHYKLIGFLTIIGTTIYYFIFRKEYKRHKLVLHSFAKKNNLIFSEDYDIGSKEKTCQLLNVGGVMIFNYLQGSYKNRKIEIYNYLQKFSSGKNSTTYEYTVFEVKTKTDLPSAIIGKEESYLWNILGTINLPINFIKCEKLQTESNEFNNLFKIYLKKDHTNKDELKTLEILSPDIMEKMVKAEQEDPTEREINLEFNKNTIILYKYGFIKNEKDIERFLNLAILIAESAEK